MSTQIWTMLGSVVLVILPLLVQAAPVDVDGDGIVGPLELIDLSLNWKGPALLQPWQVDGTSIYYNGGSVGINTAHPITNRSMTIRDIPGGGGLKLEDNAVGTYFDSNSGLIDIRSLVAHNLTANTLNVVDAGGLRANSLPFGDRRNVQWDPEDNGKFYYDNSSRRSKENIEPLRDDFDKLLSAEPKTYTRPGNTSRREIGYIAEEFDQLGLEKLVDYDSAGRPDGINYEKICLYLTEVAKRQKQELETQRRRIADLSARLDRLEALTRVSHEVVGHGVHPASNQIE